jgi:hypothetical protein
VSASASADIFEKSASAALFGERERWFLGALVKLGIEKPSVGTIIGCCEVFLCAGIKDFEN